MKPNGLFPLRIMVKIVEVSKKIIITLLVWSKKKVDYVGSRILVDPLLDALVVQFLVGLRLPS